MDDHRKYQEINDVVNTGERDETIDGQPANLIEAAKRVMDMRDACADLLPKSIFRDAAWDLMLELFVASEHHDDLCITQLVSISGEPLTNALRRIDRLEEARLLFRKQDEIDHRRVLLRLSEKGRAAMVKMLTSLYNLEAPGSDMGPRSFRPARY